MVCACFRLGADTCRAGGAEYLASGKGVVGKEGEFLSTKERRRETEERKMAEKGGAGIVVVD